MSETANPSTTAPGGRRAESTRRLLESAPASDLPAFADDVRRWFANLSVAIVDAIAEDDSETLAAVRDHLKDLVSDSTNETMRAAGLALLDIVRAAVSNAHHDRAMRRTEPGSVRAQILEALHETSGLSNDHLCEQLGTSKSVISRALRGLLRDRLVSLRRYGRRNVLRLTAAGQEVVERMHARDEDVWSPVQIEHLALEKIEQTVSAAAGIVFSATAGWITDALMRDTTQVRFEVVNVSSSGVRVTGQLSMSDGLNQPQIEIRPPLRAGA